jgi:hypothetical protein
MQKATLVLLSAILASATVTDTADARRRRQSRRSTKAKGSATHRLIKQIKAKDDLSARLAKRGKAGCKHRNEYGNRYTARFEYQDRHHGTIRFEVEYTDRGGKDNRGDCIVDKKDILKIIVRYHRNSTNPLETEYVDDKLDSSFLGNNDKVDFFCQKGSMNKREQRLLDSVMNSRYSSYKCGFSYDGSVFKTHPKRHKRAIRDYRGKVSTAYKHLKRQKR